MLYSFSRIPDYIKTNQMNNSKNILNNKNSLYKNITNDI